MNRYVSLTESDDLVWCIKHGEVHSKQDRDPQRYGYRASEETVTEMTDLLTPAERHYVGFTAPWGWTNTATARI